MARIVTLTLNPAIDKSAHVENVVPEHKLRCYTFRQEPGGGGINISRAIRELGGDSKAFYLTGGMTGQILQGLLDREGLDHHPIPIHNWTRESLAITEDATDQQFRFNMSGPQVETSEWQQCLKDLAALDLRSDSYVVASGSLPPGVPSDFYARIARLTQAAGARFILDTSNPEALHLALEEGVYLIKPNLREFKEMVGSKLLLETEQEEKAMALVEKGKSRVVVVSLGAAGVLLATTTGCARLRAPTVPIKSKVGAGDSTVAGIVLGLVQGKPIQEAVRFGVACGAAAVMTPGSELCRREDAERLYRSIARSSLTWTQETKELFLG